jgi:hypothetical protein
MSSSGKNRVGARQKLPAQPPFFLFENQKEENFESGMAGIAKLLEGRKNIVVITGAGISVSSGIPDFRSKDIGIYETLDMEVSVCFVLLRYIDYLVLTWHLSIFYCIGSRIILPGGPL